VRTFAYTHCVYKEFYAGNRNQDEEESR